jgi:hypothetical protein
MDNQKPWIEGQVMQWLIKIWTKQTQSPTKQYMNYIICNMKPTQTYGELMCPRRENSSSSTSGTGRVKKKEVACNYVTYM